MPDANRVNNYFPRKIKYSFLISQPPITIHLTDGLRAGVWLTNIYPISVMKRVHFPLEFRLAASYGVKSGKPGYSLYAHSWLGMPTNLWTYSVLFEDVRGTQNRRLHAGYRWSDYHTIP